MSESLCAIYQGIVVRDDDPQKRHRVVLRIPQILGASHTGWCEPATQTAIAPAVGTKVLVSFMGGDIRKPVWHPAGVSRTAVIEGPVKVTVNSDGLAHLFGGPRSSDASIPVSLFPYWAIADMDYLGQVFNATGSALVVKVCPQGVVQVTGSMQQVYFDNFYRVA